MASEQRQGAYGDAVPGKSRNAERNASSPAHSLTKASSASSHPSSSPALWFLQEVHARVPRSGLTSSSYMGNRQPSLDMAVAEISPSIQLKVKPCTKKDEEYSYRRATQRGWRLRHTKREEAGIGQCAQLECRRLEVLHQQAEEIATWQDLLQEAMLEARAGSGSC